MPLKTYTTFTCDRDGTTSNSVEGPPAHMVLTPAPAGWVVMQTMRQPEGGQPVAQTVYLCPACAASFNTFLAAK